MNKEDLQRCIEEWKNTPNVFKLVSAEFCYKVLVGGKTTVKRDRYKYHSYTKKFYKWIKEEWTPFIYSLSYEEMEELEIRSVMSSRIQDPYYLSIEFRTTEKESEMGYRTRRKQKDEH